MAIPTPLKLLDALAARMPEPAGGRPAANGHAPISNMSQWLPDHGLTIRKEKTWKDAMLFELEHCPWNAEHVGTARVIQFSNGAIDAGCFHDSCQNKAWCDLRDVVDGGWRDRDRAKRPFLGNAPGAKSGLPGDAPLMDNSVVPDDGNAAAENSLSTRPPIDAAEGDLPVIVGQAWAALHAGNVPPVYFRSGSYMTRIGRGDHGEPISSRVSEDALRGRLARVAFFSEVREREDGGTYRVATLPPRHVVKDMLAHPDLPLPVLTRIAEVPFFAPSGRLVVTPGYDAEAHAFYAPGALKIAPIAETPTSETRGRALDLINEMLCDFPFRDPADRAHSIALMLAGVARELIDGPTPLHLIEKPSPGTGATLLVDAIAWTLTGRPMGTMTEARDDDEWRKRIAAQLAGGPSLTVIDNLRRTLDSAALSGALTSRRFEDRRLGVNTEMLRLPVTTLWVATANNPQLSHEMIRRTVRIRLDAQVEQPWLRDPAQFRHPNLVTWVRAQRGDLVWALCVLVQAWLAEGRPIWTKPHLGMFEAWGEVVGGILAVAGIGGFLGNLQEFYQAVDEEEQALREFVQHWWKVYQERETTATALLGLIETDDIGVDLGMGDQRSRATRLGRLLVQQRERIIGGLRVVRAGKSAGLTRWRLAPIREAVKSESSGQ